MSVRAFRLRANNYKSLGALKNELELTNGLTVVIGKNESGKTNLLEAASELDFSRRPYHIADAKRKLNRLSSGGEIEIALTLKSDDVKAGLTSIVAKRDEISISGDLVERLRDSAKIRDCLSTLSALDESSTAAPDPANLFKQEGASANEEIASANKEIASANEEIASANKERELVNDTRQLFKEARELALNFYSEFCANPYQLLDNLERLTNRLLHKGTSFEMVYGAMKRLYRLTSEFVRELPYLLFINNDAKNNFKEHYFLDELNELDSEDIFLKLLKCAGISLGWLTKAPHGVYGIPSILKPMNSSINDKISAGLARVARAFSNFSDREFQLGLRLSSGRAELTTVKDGRVIFFDELEVSDKWFFALFVDVMWRGALGSSILFVLDQPGLFMHVTAQKELMKHLNTIAGKNHQVIYTTHSPYLLDINDIASIRAVEKDQGQTFVYNKIYAAEQSGQARLETLTPIFEALGVGFSPEHALEKTRLNLIVEGISDFYYIKAMLHYFNSLSRNKGKQTRTNNAAATLSGTGVGANGSGGAVLSGAMRQLIKGLFEDEGGEPYVLPAVGASNISNVASILIGWGQPFKAIVDYDEEGNKAAEKMEYKLGLAMGEDVFYINGRSRYDGESACRVEDMIAHEDRKKIALFAEKQTKALLSRAFYDQVVAGRLTPSKATVQNFTSLFNALAKSLKERPKKFY